MRRRHQNPDANKKETAIPFDRCEECPDRDGTTAGREERESKGIIVRGIVKRTGEHGRRENSRGVPLTPDIDA
jgi:hypothetical protein